jgi:hypothetical protein
MRPRDPFQYYLTNYPTTTNFYEDVNGNIQTTNVPTPLKHSPGGWIDTELKFSRSKGYYGINRTYSIPLKFVGDGASIIRYRFYNGRGIEESIQLVVLKWQDQPQTINGVYRPGDSYYLYYKGLLDLSKMKDNVQEGVTVNVMEGGVVQLLKSYENTVFEIPCDGSIPQNIKVNVDGILLNDTFHYTFLNVKGSFAGIGVVPAVFQSNDGDNVGVIQGNPTYEQPTGAGLSYFQSSQNFLFSSIYGTTVTLTGSIIVQADWRQPSIFYLYTATNFSNPRGVGDLDHAVGLVLNQQPLTTGATPYFQPIKSQITVTGQMVLNFSISQTLGAGENLFLLFFNQFANYPITILGGNFDITFNSRYQPSRVWGITAWDLFQLLIQSINTLSSNFLQTFNFGSQSQLLQDNLGLVVTSGDALRASTDPNYFQYFNLATQNVANPNNQQFAQFQTLGPCIKTSLKEFFDAFNPILNASLSNIKVPGQQEAIFFEEKAYVFDSSEVTMTLGEVADFDVAPYEEQMFNWLRIGYENPSLDQKQGKFEYNTKLQMQAPVKTLARTLDIICKYHTAPYLIEYVRSNPPTGVSTTNNDHDNDKFVLSTDLSSYFLDFFNAMFISTDTNTSDPANTNYLLLANVNSQGMFCPTLNGEYFTSDNQPTIFMWNQPIISVTQTVVVAFQAVLNGLYLTDTCTVKMWYNGTVLQQWSQLITGVNTAFNVSLTFTQAFSLHDSVWFTVDTTSTQSAVFGAFSIAVSDGSGNYFNAALAGTLTMNQGSVETLVALPIVVPRMVAHVDGIQHPVVSYGFQYFRFIDILVNSDFTVEMAISVLTSQNAGQQSSFFLWINGQSQGSFTFTTGTTQTAQNSILTTPTRTFGLYDIVWITADVSNTHCWVTNILLQFNSQIKVYNLLRENYTNISGILNASTAYNIEPLTPARMTKAWGNYLRSLLWNLVPSQLTFQTLDKNQYLSTVLNGVTTTENANVNISDLDTPLFLGLIFTFKTQVPVNFADILTGAANGHVQFSYLGQQYYGFPLEVTQKPSLNDTQEWTLLASPLNNLSVFQNLNFDGLNPNFLNIMANEIFISHICPLKFVPNGITRNPQYNFIHMDDDWFINQVQFWIFKENYFQKAQLNDTIPIQILTNGIGSGNVLVYDCHAKLIATVPLIANASTPLQAPYIQLECTISPASLGFTSQVYYFVIQAGGATPVISEGVQFATVWPRTMLWQYSNSQNKQSTVFSTGYQGAFRAEAWLSEFSAEAKFTTYEDQPMDIVLLNNINYRKFKLNVAAPKGVPDWVWDKVRRIMGLDTVTIDGHAYTLDDGAKGEVKNSDSWPKRYWSIDIREAVNSEGVTFNASGVVQNPVVVATIDLNAFQENPITTPNLIQVIQS